MQQHTKVEDLNVVGTAPLISPNDLDVQVPITEEIAEHVVRGRAQIEAILNGTDQRLLVIAGPARFTMSPLRWSTPDGWPRSLRSLATRSS